MLRNAAQWVDAGIQVTGNARKAWDVIAPLLRRSQAGEPGPAGFMKKVLNGLALAQSALALWKHWRDEE
jgi:hypothetical protein